MPFQNRRLQGMTWAKIGVLLLVLSMGYAASPANAAVNTKARTAQSQTKLTLSPTSSLGNGIPLAMAWSPDGKTLAVGTKYALWLHDIAHLDAPPRSPLPTSQSVNGVAYSSDGKTLLYSSCDLNYVCALHVLNADSGQETTTLAAETTIKRFVLSPDNQSIAYVGLYDVRIKDLSTGQERSIMEAGKPLYDVTAIAYNADGSLLAMGTHDGPISVWDIKTSQTLVELAGHQDQVNGIAFSPDGKTLYSAGWQEGFESTVRAWDIAAGKEKPFAQEGDSLNALTLSADGRYLVTGSILPSGYGLNVRDATSGARIAELLGHRQALKVLSMSLDGKWLASASSEAVFVWDTATHALKAQLPGYYGEVQSLALSPDDTLLAFGGQNREVHLIDRAAHTELTLTGYTGYRGIIAFSPDSKLLFYPTLHDYAYGFAIVDAHTGDSIKAVELKSWVLGAAFSPDGKLLATGDYYGNIAVWDTTTWAQRLTLTGHGGEVNRVLFSPDGKLLVSSGHDDTVRLWDLTSGDALNVLQAEGDYSTYGIEALALSRDGSRLAYNGPDHTIVVWNMQTKKRVGVLRSDQYFTTAVIFSPDGKFLISTDGLYQAVVRVWDLSFLAETQSVTVQRENISDMVMNASGTELISSSKDGTVLMWAVDN